MRFGSFDFLAVLSLCDFQSNKKPPPVMYTKYTVTRGILNCKLKKLSPPFPTHNYFFVFFLFFFLQPFFVMKRQPIFKPKTLFHRDIDGKDVCPQEAHPSCNFLFLLFLLDKNCQNSIFRLKIIS